MHDGMHSIKERGWLTMEFKAHEYQERMIQRVINQDHIGLFLSMGL